MKRRDFLKFLLSTPIAATIDVEKLLWVPEKTIFIPSDAQIAFFNRNKYPALWGIPYHESNGTTGSWLGIDRTLPWN